jgi:hypothetical protein
MNDKKKLEYPARANSVAKYWIWTLTNNLVFLKITILNEHHSKREKYASKFTFQ